MSTELFVFVVAGYGLGAVFALPMLVSALRRRSGGSEGSSKDMTTDALLKAQGEQIKELRAQLADTNLQLRIQNQWITELCAQLTEAGMRPVTELEVRRNMGLPNGVTVHRANGPVHTWIDVEKGLREVLYARFNVDDLRVLAIDTGIGEDALAGESKTAKVLGLIARAREREMLRELVDAVERMRPGSTRGLGGDGA